jgi:hypothetical protein
MKRFFAVTEDEFPLDSDWYCTKANGKRVPVVDQAVYDKDRNMRTLFSCKKGSSVPFGKISGDPLLDVLIPSPSECDVASDYSLFSITKPANTPISVSLLEHDTDQPMQRGSVNAAPRPAVQRPASVQQGQLPFSLERLQQLLVNNGDKVSVVMGNRVKVNKHSDSYIVPCDQRKQCRHCLHCSDRFHVSNNCRLVVSLDNSKRWRVDYHCYAAECKDLASRCIGFIAHDIPPPVEPEAVQPAAQPDAQPAPAAPAAPVSHGVFSRQPDETYNAPLLKKLPTVHRVVAVRSACGTGKTKCLTSMLIDEDKVRNMNVIVICHRKSLSKKVRQTFPSLKGSDWFYYTDHKKPVNAREHPYMVFQSESLGRLMYEGLLKDSDRETILVIDEAVSVFHQFKSDFGNREATQSMFYHLCQNAEMVIALDGYLDQDTLDIFEKYTGEQAYLIHNTYQSRAAHKVQFTRDVKGATRQLLKCVQKGERCIAPCFSKEHAENIYKQAKALFGDTKKVLLYTQDCPLNGADVNVVWSDADLVIYTSTIDCGISCETAGLFEWCFAFFDNGTGPTYFAAAQMISRARDVKKFIICCTHKKYHARSLDKNDILNDPKMSKVILKADILFFGVGGYGEHKVLHPGRRTWETCSPIAASIAFIELGERQTHVGIHQYLQQLLQQDGAQVAREWLKYDAQQEPLVDKAAVDAVVLEQQDPQALLKDVIRKYKFNGFDPADEEKLRMYAKPAKVSAYENLNQLAENGSGFAEALDRRKRDVGKCALGLELIKQAGKMDQNAIDTVAISSRVFGGNYMIDANETAVQFLEVITGATDPFNIPAMSSTVIAARLECEVVVSAISGSQGERERHDLHLSPAKAAQVGSAYKEWILTKPSLHTPSRLYNGGPLSLVKAVSMLNHVLVTMYDMTFKREGNTKKVNGDRTHTYAACVSEDFPRVNPDFSCHKTKPSIKLWTGVQLKDLSEGEILRVGKRHLQLGPGYATRRGGDYGCAPLPPIQAEDLIPASKKRRL